MNTKILLLPTLVETLLANNIKPEDYKPAYGGKSVGLDLYNVGPELYIHPAYSDQDQNRKILIPTGLKICLPYGWAALIQERGSITKTPFKVRAGVIDPEYTGEIFINCVNLAPSPGRIAAGSKTSFQLIVVPCDTSFERVDEQTYTELASGSSRQEGSIGSSDRR